MNFSVGGIFLIFSYMRVRFSLQKWLEVCRCVEIIYNITWKKFFTRTKMLRTRYFVSIITKKKVLKPTEYFHNKKFDYVVIETWNFKILCLGGCVDCNLFSKRRQPRIHLLIFSKHKLGIWTLMLVDIKAAVWKIHLFQIHVDKKIVYSCLFNFMRNSWRPPLAGGTY